MTGSWNHTFKFRQMVRLAGSEEVGVVVGIYINHDYCVRYVNGAGVLVQKIWPGDALVAADDGAQVKA